MSLPAKHYPHFFTPPTQFGDNSRLPQLRNRDQAFGIRPHDDDDEDVHRSFKRSKFPNTTISLPKLNTRSKREATYKTRMCLEFRKSSCAFGDRCHFVHSSTEIRKRLSCWKDEVHVKETASSCDQMKLCKWSSNGYECPDGNRGYFHNDDKRSCAIDIASVGGELKRSGDSSSRANEEYWCWKTKLCNNWQATNDCPYGSKCRFAHGKTELCISEVKYRNLSYAVTLIDPAKDESYKRRGDTEEQQVDDQGFLIRLKEVRKFIGIYADWIEDSTFGVCNSEVKYRSLSSTVTLVDPAKDEAYKRCCGDNEEQQLDGQVS